MAADELMQIRITADFKEAEGAFLKMAKVATAFESDFRRISNGLNKEFNKINGMAELFGNSTNVVKDKMDALKRSMEQLMALGIQPMNPQVQKLKAQYDSLAATLDKTTQETNKNNAANQNSSNTLKKTNQQWTNLALVVQDLPYGFRGIQNNLPALLGGISGIAGVGYLAFSAIIAGLTFWDEHNRKVAASSKKLKEEQDAILNSVSSEAVKVNELIIILENENETRDRKKRALKDLQAINPDVFKDLKLEGDKVKNLNEYYNAYIENLKNIILLKKYEKDLEAIIQAELKTGKPIQVAKQKELKSTSNLLNLNNQALKDNINTAKISSSNDQNIINNINKYNNAQKQKLDLLDKIRKISSSVSLGGGGTADNNKKEISDREKTLTTIAENEKNAALELYDGRDKELRQITDKYRKQIDLATKYGQETIFLEQARNAELYAINKKWDDIEFKRNQDSINANIAFETKIYEDSNRIWDQIQKEKLDAQIAFAKRQTSSIETELGVQDKLNKNSLKLRIEDTKQALAKLAVLAAFTFDPKVLAVYLDAIDKMTAKLKGLGSTWDETTKAIDSIIKNFINDSLFTLGESLGKALMGENVDALDAFGTLLADAIQALGKQLIAYGTVKLAALKALETTTPMGAMLAIAAGVAAVAAGAALKASLKHSPSGSSLGTSSNTPKKFANGGIISGPTYGLMGEYPGAKSNPEVVAPLDKLKDMIGGGGGGTFMLRGQDLLLSVNRAQKASNLKGQNISLA